MPVAKPLEFMMGTALWAGKKTVVTKFATTATESS